MEIKIPQLSLVAMVGISGSGKSSFARKHFKKTEIISSDECRGLVSDDESNQSASEDAFALLYYLANIRLKNGLLTVIDATNVQESGRKNIVQLARSQHCLPVAIVLNLPLPVCEARHQNRSDRNFGGHVLRNQYQQLKRSLKRLKEEGFRKIYVLNSEQEVEAVTSIAREKLYSDKKELTGPFDIIGDVHGCVDELKQLLTQLGYQITNTKNNRDSHDFGYQVTAPAGRTAVFLGDLVDRGPASPEVLRLVMSMVRSQVALCVVGNHDSKLSKYLSGKKVNPSHGLAQTISQLELESIEFKNEVHIFLESLISHYVLDQGKLVVAHAGLKEEMHGRGSGAVRAFCMYGETTGEIDEYGLPVRHNWASEYRGKPQIVYGHTPVPHAEWLNRTIDIDTGCVFGGHLTALRYPEQEIVAVPAQQVYCEPVRPVNQNSNNSNLSTQQNYDDLLDIADVIGERIIQTRLRNNLTIQEENSIAALEQMSRFSVNPKWLIYLPPTMSPTASSQLPDFLEHPKEAIEYYQRHNVTHLVCEEKHMGSRAILIICKNEQAATRHFGVTNEGIGVCYTRTGRSFFNHATQQQALLERVNRALTKADFWTRFQTDWVCLDAEVMPWSLKAQGLLESQYAAVGSAASTTLPEVEKFLQMAHNRGVPGVDSTLNKFKHKTQAVTKYIQAYQRYCWEVKSLDDYQVAPFHILATNMQTHTDKTHEWHMFEIGLICEQDAPFLKATPYQIIDITKEQDVQKCIDWWLDLTQKGGEGIVLKPNDFIVKNEKGIIQPAIKCRGAEYLRIIYGPEYDAPENLTRLKNRSLTRKQSLALREFALSIEGLERFVRNEPLRRVHGSVFAVLALESEEIDPRL